jgi:hypothetical protein
MGISNKKQGMSNIEGVWNGEFDRTTLLAEVFTCVALLFRAGAEVGLPI